MSGAARTILLLAVIAGGCEKRAAARRDAGPAPAAPETSGPALVHHELPGFAVALPDGERKKDDRARYDDGEIATVAPRGAPWRLVLLTWTPGHVVGQPAAEEAMVVGMIKGSGLPLERRGTLDLPVSEGLPARTWTLRAGDISVLMTAVTCGRRTLSVATVGDRGDAEALQGRVVASLRCTPVAAQEAVEERPPLTLSEAGWTEDRSERFARTWRRGTDEMVIFIWVSDSGAIGAVAVEAALPALGFEPAVTAAPAVAGQPAWQARGPRGYVLATTIPCAGRRALAYYIGPTDRRAASTLRSARCTP